MNRSTDASNAYKPVQPATAIASHRVLPDKVAEYCEAQAAITEAARKFPGFVGTEVLSPVAGLQEEWVAMFRLESNQACAAGGAGRAVSGGAVAPAGPGQ
jgi:antibiotic biosynthesis monooxygenase (ABM) superfamily enzyme